jgi:hypothetical protein
VQAGNFLHYLAIFVAGIAVSFGSVWQLTAVTLSVLPLLAIAAGAYFEIRVGQMKWSQEAYADAGGIAEEVRTYPQSFSLLVSQWRCKLDFIFSGVSCAVSNNVMSMPLWILCQRNLKFFCDMFLGNATNKSMDKDIC